MYIYIYICIHTYIHTYMYICIVYYDDLRGQGQLRGGEIEPPSKLTVNIDFPQRFVWCCLVGLTIKGGTY